MQYFHIINLPVLEPKLLNNWLGIWKFGFLPNKLREFIFKSNSNILGTNARIAHFVVNTDKSCTCCKIKNLYFLKEPKKNEYKINDQLGKVARKSRSKAVYIKICESDLIGSTPASNVPRLVMVIFRQGGF